MCPVHSDNEKGQGVRLWNSTSQGAGRLTGVSAHTERPIVQGLDLALAGKDDSEDPDANNGSPFAVEVAVQALHSLCVCPLGHTYAEGQSWKTWPKHGQKYPRSD